MTSSPTAEKKRPEVAIYQMQAEVQKQSLKDINSELLPTLNMYGLYAGAGTAGPLNPLCNSSTQDCSTNLPTGFPSMFANTFNYSSPEYQVGMTLSINLRNRQAKADQFRAVLQYRQSQISSEQQQKGIRFDVRNSKFALEQAQAHVEAAQKARDLAQKTFDITKQEQAARREVRPRYPECGKRARRGRVRFGHCANGLREEKGRHRSRHRRNAGAHRRLHRRREIGRRDSVAVESRKGTMLSGGGQFPSKQERIRVLVADDQPHILEAVELLLAPQGINVDLRPFPPAAA
jgi:hypothetical protein